jgi:hypothetical protein
MSELLNWPTVGMMLFTAFCAGYIVGVWRTL